MHALRATSPEIDTDSICVESIEDYVDFPDPIEHLIGFICYSKPKTPD